MCVNYVQTPSKNKVQDNFPLVSELIYPDGFEPYSELYEAQEAPFKIKKKKQTSGFFIL